MNIPFFLSLAGDTARVFNLSKKNKTTNDTRCGFSMHILLFCASILLLLCRWLTCVCVCLSSLFFPNGILQMPWVLPILSVLLIRFLFEYAYSHMGAFFLSTAWRKSK